jgi:hypothetical protein
VSTRSVRKIAQSREGSADAQEVGALAGSPRPAIVIELPPSEFVDAHELPLWMAAKENPVRQELLAGVEQDGEIRPFERSDVPALLSAEEFRELGEFQQRRHAHYAALRALVETGALPARNGRGEPTKRWMEDTLLLARADAIRYLAERGFAAAGSDVRASRSVLDTAPVVLPLKKQALIRKHKRDWPSIENDLINASRNGLANLAKAGDQGWVERNALAWAESKGKLQRSGSAAEKPVSIDQALHTRQHRIKG